MRPFCFSEWMCCSRTTRLGGLATRSSCIYLCCFLIFSRPWTKCTQISIQERWAHRQKETLRHLIIACSITEGEVKLYGKPAGRRVGAGARILCAVPQTTERRDCTASAAKVWEVKFRFYGEGVVHDDLKFWSGLARKKFMNMNYASMFWFILKKFDDLSIRKNEKPPPHSQLLDVPEPLQPQAPSPFLLGHRQPNVTPCPIQDLHLVISVAQHALSQLLALPSELQ